MRKLSLIILLVFFCAVSGFAQVNDPEARKLFNQGIKEHDSGNYEKAISLYEQALEIEPDNEVIIYEMGYSYSALKNYQSVISLISERVEKGKVKNPDLYVLLGNVYDMMDDPYKSIETYKAGLNKFPNSGLIYYNYGITLAQQKEMEKALEKFEKGIAVDPSYASNFYMAAKLLKGSNQEIWSILYGEMYINIIPDNDRAAELSKMIYDFYTTRIKKTDEGYTVSINPFSSLGDKDKVNLQARYEMDCFLGVTALQEYGDNLDGFAHLRDVIATLWNEKKEPEYKNILFDRQKELMNINKDYLTCYNYLILAYADPDRFSAWYNKNKTTFDDFAEWTADHPIKFTAGTKYYRQQYE